MPRTPSKRKLEACHTESEEEASVVAIKEAFEPARKKGRKSSGKANKTDEQDEEATGVSFNLSKQRFESEAVGFEINLENKKCTMTPKKFKSGSVGWQYSGTIETSVDEKIFSINSNFLATVIKSKDWDENGKETEETKKETDEEDEEGKEEEKEEMNEQTVEGQNERPDEEEQSIEKSRSDTNPEMTRKEFMSKAKNITVSGFDKDLLLKPKEFKTNNVGWYGCAKSKRKLGDETLSLQVNLTLTIPNSKKWKAE